jgi:hypothetical protein
VISQAKAPAFLLGAAFTSVQGSRRHLLDRNEEEISQCQS